MVVHLLWSGILVGLICVFTLPCLGSGCSQSYGPRDYHIVTAMFGALNLPVVIVNRIWAGPSFFLIPFDSILYAWLLVTAYKHFERRRETT